MSREREIQINMVFLMEFTKDICRNKWTHLRFIAVELFVWMEAI